MKTYFLLLCAVVTLTACNNQSAPTIDLAKEQQNFGLESALKEEISQYQNGKPMRAAADDMEGW